MLILPVVDKQYIIAQGPRLLEEMINSLLIVLSMANEDRELYFLSVQMLLPSELTKLAHLLILS